MARRNKSFGGGILLIILAISFLPITITIWILKSSLSKKTKAIILLIMWIGIPVAGYIYDSFIPDIKGISQESINPIVIVTKKNGNTYFSVETTKDNAVTDETVLIKIDDPSIAKVVKRTNNKSGSIECTVLGLKAGTTYIYAETPNGEYSSKKREITVRNPIPVENVIISPISSIPIGESTVLGIKVEPSDADVESYRFISSDSNVVSVDTKGNLTALAKGVSTITATVNNVSSSIDVMVDTSVRTMKFRITPSRVDDYNIGDEWSFEYEINDEKYYSFANGDYRLHIGDQLQLRARITESDDKPDVGTASSYHVVTENDLLEGFEVNVDVYVTENGGKNSGLSAHYVVSFEFFPKSSV